MIKAYAGIGSRDISDSERRNIIIIAKILAKSDYILYSGNASGSDIAFQEGSGGKCVVMLPWDGFNIEEYDYSYSRDYFVLGSSKMGLESVDKFHPNPPALSRGMRGLMARNYHQVAGYKEYPRVSLVVCCASVQRTGGVSGGTGQAVRIAQSMHVPVINIREYGWRDKLIEYAKL